MDITTPPPPPPGPLAVPPPPPPPPRARASAASVAARLRRAVADLTDLAVLGAVASAVGLLVAQAFRDDDDPWAVLAMLLVGLAAAGVTAFLGWVVLLVRIRGGHVTPGERLAGLAPTGQPLHAAGRHVALALGAWCALGVVPALREPTPEGPLAALVAAGLAAGAAALAYGVGPWQRRAGVVAVVAIASGVVAGVVPDRPPHVWELQDDARAAVVRSLEQDPLARRRCDVEDATGTPGADVPLASHATTACFDPDREWRVDRRPVATAARLAEVVEDEVGDHAAVRVDRQGPVRAVLVDEATVAVVAADLDCGSSVTIGYGATMPGDELGAALCT